MGSFSIWHWLVVIGVLAIGGVIPFYWLRKRNQKKYPDRLEGFSGWLALLALGVYLAPLRSLVNLSKLNEGVDAATKVRFHLVFEGEVAIILLLLLMQIVLAVFMARKLRRFISMFIWTGIYIFISTPLDLTWVSAIVSSQTGQTFSSVMDTIATADVFGNWIGATITVAIWMLYVTRSRRVANTFNR